MQSGDMRDVLSFRHPTKTRGATGEEVLSSGVATQYAQERGRIEPLRGRELEQGRAVMGEATHRVHAWWNSATRHDDVIVTGTRTFQIGWIENVDEMDKEMRLLVKERFN